MKKMILVVCALFTFVSVALAQTGAKFGVMGAFNYTTSTTPDQFQYKDLQYLNWRAGYKAGLIADVPLSAVFSVQPSLLFSSKGYEVIFGYKTAHVKLEATANYIELPVTLAFKIPISDAFKLGVHAGPYLAYGVGGKTGSTGRAGGVIAWDTFKGDELAYFLAMERFDWGLTLGAALEVGRLKFSFNYDQGLKGLYDVDDRDNNAYNYGIWVGAGIFL